jgi:elongation factor Ts
MAETREIDAKTVMALRGATGAAMMDCKTALKETGGDLEKAKDWLRKKGKQIADKKADRETKAGTIASYVHMGGKIGVLLELKCETDFVARNEEFQQLARDLCMQIAATRPVAVSRERVPAEVIEREKAVYRESDQLKGKPENMIEKIIEGKLEAFYKEKCLLDQAFVKDATGKTTVRDLVQGISGKMGENVQVGRFARFELGEAIN